MSRPLDPCNCEQAKCYEKLLEKVLSNLAADALELQPVYIDIRQEIRTALAAYAQATEEYKQEG